MSFYSCRVEGEGGNREVPAAALLGARAGANIPEEGGSRGKPGFPRATEPKAEDAA